MAGADYGTHIYRNGQPVTSNTVGQGRVHFTVHKYIITLVIDGKPVDQQEFILQYALNDVHLYDDILVVDTMATSYAGNVYGYQFTAIHFAGNLIDLRLIEPDGTVWCARAGYDADWDAMGQNPLPRWLQKVRERYEYMS